MKLLLDGFLLINLVIFIIFAIGKTVVLRAGNNPNFTAFYSVIMGVGFIIYLFSIGIISIVSLIKHSYLPLLLMPFVLAPFIIGKKSTYAKIKFYSNLQLLAFLASFFLTFLIIKVI